MTIAYVDTSWLVERRSGLWGSRSLPRDHAAFVTSVATRVEVARTIRPDEMGPDSDREVEESLLGVDALPISDQVVRWPAVCRRAT